MKHRTADLEGALLDAAVAKAEGATIHPGSIEWPEPTLESVYGPTPAPFRSFAYSPSTEWSDGGPIIERELIGTACVGLPPMHWQANVRGSGVMIYGDSPLVAAMRAYVRIKVGEEIEL